MICRGGDDNRLHLIGVTSFGPSGKCAQEKPNVVARISTFYDWIEAQINGPNAINRKYIFNLDTVFQNVVKITFQCFLLSLFYQMKYIIYFLYIMGTH